MSDAPSTLRVRRNTARAPFGQWLTALALLAACGSDTDAPAELGCPTPLPAGCVCVAEALSCNSAPITSAPDAGGGAALGDAAAPRSDAAVVGSTDAGRDAAAPSSDASVDAGTTGPNNNTDAGSSSDASADAGSSSDSGTPDAAADAGPPPNNATGFVGEHGALHVQGNRVVDRNGKAIQLRGMSWFWSQWTDFYVAKNVDVLVDEWKATLVRAALGVENEGGYLENAQANVTKVRTIVDRAIARGIYVIIDWHDHNAQNHVAQSTAFFEEMARAYGKQPHVIFEVFNEPLQVPWSSVKAYAEPLIKKIRAAGGENLIIVGTPTWSQDVDAAASDRITMDSNVAYTLHFYANTHKQSLRDKAKTALDRGAALFVTEWGTCSADGNGTINEAETRTWLNFLKDNSISWANWALNNKAEACSALQPAASSTGPWQAGQLTPSGALVKSLMP